METEEILAAIQKAADTIATPNWADIASVGLSLLAVVVAGFVAWKQVKIAKKQNEIVLKQTEIASQQNIISLLEKRIEVYNLALCCQVVANDISKIAKNSKEAEMIFRSSIKKWPFILVDATINQEDIGETEIKIILEKLSEAEFLFSGDISKPLTELAYWLVYVMYAREEEFIMFRDFLLQTLWSIEDNRILDKAKNELQLKLEVSVCPSPNPPTNPPSSSYSPKWATPTSTPPT